MAPQALRALKPPQALMALRALMAPKALKPLDVRSARARRAARWEPVRARAGHRRPPGAAAPALAD
jgi:hypothetical protein